MGRNGRDGGGDLATVNEFGYYVPRKYWASRLAPYVGEWAGVALMWPIAEGTHLGLGGPESVAWASVGLTALGVGLTRLTWYVGMARGQMTQWMATATVSIGALWLIVATIIGPTHAQLVWAWVYGGATLALAWNIKRALRSGDEDGTASLFEKVKLAKVRTGPITAAPNKVTVPLSLTAGESSVEDVQAASDKLAQALRLHKGSVRTVADPEDLSRGTMTIVPTDVLRHPQPWPGPSHPGGSIAEALVPGLYEDSEPVQLFLPGDPSIPRNATHVQVNGMNGSGKSGGAVLCWTDILTRRDVVLAILDPSKGEQTAGFLPDDSAHLVIGLKECQAFVRRLVTAITAQADQLGKWGFDQWVPEVYRRHQMPYLVIWIEEASKVLADAATMTDIVETARSAGITIVMSQQKSSFRRMNTDIRSQLGTGWCFGVNDIVDASYCLSEEVIDAGARPDRWKNRRPGCFHLEADGIEDSRLPMPARTYIPDKTAMTHAIEAHADIRARLLPATAAALGLAPRPVRTTTIRPAQPAEQRPNQRPEQQGGPVVTVTTLPGTAPTETGPSTAGLAHGDDLDAMAELSDELDSMLVALPAEHEPDLEVDLNMDADAELPADPDTDDIRLPGTRPSRAQARAKLNALLERMAAASRARGTAGEFTIRDLPEPAQMFGRGRSWLSVELSRLAQTGRLEALGQDGNAIIYRFRDTREEGSAGGHARDAA